MLMVVIHFHSQGFLKLHQKTLKNWANSSNSSKPDCFLLHYGYMSYMNVEYVDIIKMHFVAFAFLSIHTKILIVIIASRIMHLFTRLVFVNFAPDSVFPYKQSR